MKTIASILLLFFIISCNAQLQPLKVSSNKHFFATNKDKPFFWLGDTGWLLFIKCSREEAKQYLDDRAAKGFNVIQAMLLHDINLGTNKYGDSAFSQKDISKPVTTKGSKFSDAAAYDFWDHVDFIIKEAAKRNMYMALVPMWGSNVKNFNTEQCKAYATFVANRYKNFKNIIWLNGGDIKGSDALENWNTIGNTINNIDTKHLITFHPRGRNSSSFWFHTEDWLDFNMFQSGHRSYEQDTSSKETLHYGEDNWKYVDYDYNLQPIKPTFDAEPSYEDIPYGLHKPDVPYWKDYEIRRYAYWNVFAGGCGHTYGHNAVMQFYTSGDSGISFFPKQKWQDGLNAPGSSQMQHLKNLMLSYSYFDRVPAQHLVVNNAQKYYRIMATMGSNYILFYVYNGRSFQITLKETDWKNYKAFWYNPRTGNKELFIMNDDKKEVIFDPPGEMQNGNDWVLILEKIK